MTAPARPTHLWFFIGNKFVRMATNSPKLNWDYPYTPDGSVHFKVRTNARQWSYVTWGQTPEEVAAKLNQHTVAEIQRLELQIARLKTRLVIPGQTHEVVR